ncbi:MAG TPA: glycosyltransferase family 2 protein [Trueperaceae bacterium]
MPDSLDPRAAGSRHANPTALPSDAPPTEPPLVHIVIVNWNGATQTLRCIAALRNLTYPNFRIVVVDNGSADDSVDVIRHQAPDVALLVSSHNLGFAGGNNLGIRHALEAHADFVWLLNNDTVVDPHSLDGMVQEAASDERIGIVGSRLYFMKEPERLQAYGGGTVSFRTGSTHHVRTRVPDEKLDYITGASMLISSRLAEAIGLLDDSYFFYWEDADYCLRARKAGWRLVVAPQSKVWHDVAASVRGGSPQQYYLFATNSVRFFQRHAPHAWASILVGSSKRLIKRLALLDFTGASSIVRGLRDGFAQRQG